MWFVRKDGWERGREGDGHGGCLLDLAAEFGEDGVDLGGCDVPPRCGADLGAFGVVAVCLASQ